MTVEGEGGKEGVRGGRKGDVGGWLVGNESVKRSRIFAALRLSRRPSILSHIRFHHSIPVILQSTLFSLSTVYKNTCTTTDII